MKSEHAIRPSDIKGHASWLSVARCYLKCQKVMNSKLNKLGMNTAQHELLMNIKHKPGCSQQQLSDRLLVVKSNISALLNKMSERGWIERRKDSKDKRKLCLYLTPQGAHILQRSMAVQIEIIQAMTAVLSDDELQTNLEVMQKVYHAFDALTVEQ